MYQVGKKSASLILVVFTSINPSSIRYSLIYLHTPCRILNMDETFGFLTSNALASILISVEDVILPVGSIGNGCSASDTISIFSPSISKLKSLALLDFNLP